jgi:hypothetical protein
MPSRDNGDKTPKYENFRNKVKGPENILWTGLNWLRIG